MRERHLARAGIALFVGVPWLLGGAHALLRPPASPSYTEQKVALLAALGSVDTFVIGDSRSARVGGDAFAHRGWRAFNFSLSGLCPEDLVLQLAYVLKTQHPRRLVIGVSFEALRHEAPFCEASTAWDPPFAELSLEPYGGAPLPARPDTTERWSLRELLPVGEARPTLRYWLRRWRGDAPVPNYERDGRAAYELLHERIRAGSYDFVAERNPARYAYTDAAYHRTRKLAEAPQRLFAGALAAVRSARIPCVVFETGRTAAYQRQVAADPVLAPLQREWRARFARESFGCVAFVPLERTADCYAEEDFFDAVHVIGPTAERLSERLAEELERLEAQQAGR